MITLYGGAMTRGGRCILTLEECGLDYELRDLSLSKGEHLAAEYLELNPNGRLPCLIDGDFVVWESMAINLYLVEKYGSGILPDSAEDRAGVYQWSFWAITALEPALSELFNQRVVLPEAERDEAVVSAQVEAAEKALAVLNDQLGDKAYVLGGAFTVADINCGHMMAWAVFVGLDLAKYGEVMRWFALLQERPAFQKLAAMQATAVT